jgi:hypothetical protein
MIHDLADGSYGKFLRRLPSYSMAYICRNLIQSASGLLVTETLVAAALVRPLRKDGGMEH